MSRVVFTSSLKLDGTDAANTNRTRYVWRVDSDGTGLQPLTVAIANGAGGGDSQWSPDGTKVVFESGRKLDGSDAPNANDNSNIWRVNADGTDLRPLTRATAEGTDSYRPRWSPDGTKVVFESGRKLDGSDARGDTSNIWRVNADGSDLRPLTRAANAPSQEAQWSPDGTKVVFQSSRKLDGTNARNANGTSNIWRVNADGTDPQPLTKATAVAAGSFEPRFSR